MRYTYRCHPSEPYYEVLDGERVVATYKYHNELSRGSAAGKAKAHRNDLNDEDATLRRT